jgi:hypothetical protein
MPVKVTLHEVGCGTQLGKRYSKKSSTAVSDGVTFDDLSPFLAYQARVSRDALGTIVAWSSLEWPREKDLTDDSTPDCSSEVAKSTAGQSDLHRSTELFTNIVPAVDPTGSSKSSREHCSSGFRNSQLRTPSPKVGAHQSVREDKGSRSSPQSSAISSQTAARVAMHMVCKTARVSSSLSLTYTHDLTAFCTQRHHRKCRCRIRCRLPRGLDLIIERETDTGKKSSSPNVV